MDELTKSLSEAVDTARSKRLDGSVLSEAFSKRYRKDMPQIKSDIQHKFLSFLKSKGVSYTRQTVQAGSLKPSQKDLNQSIIKSLEANPRTAKPAIVSKDNYVLDGHHRWAAFKNLGKDIEIWRVGVGIERLFALAEEWGGSPKKGIQDETRGPSLAAILSEKVDTARSRRLDGSTRRQANRSLERAGFDGKGRFASVSLALGKAWEALTDFGLEPDEVVSRLYKGQEGRFTQQVAWKNEDDPHSPTSITNTMLAMFWTKIDENKYEIIAYLS